MALTSRLEVEIDSRDAEQKAKALRDSLVQLEESGKLVNPALKKAGDSMSGLSDSSEKARKSVSGQSDELEALLGKLDPLRKKQTELAKSQAQLAAAFKNGDLNEASYKKFSGVIRDQVTAINSSRAALTGLNADLGKTGNSAKQNAAALRMLPAQFSDIAVSLQGGQAPLTVFLQQGSQIKDSFGGAGAAVKAFSGYLASMVNPVTVGAAAVVALGAIVVSSQGQFNEFQKALVSSGNAAGTTADQLILLSNSIAGGRNFTEASEAVLALANNGRLSGEALEAVARASTELSVATGKGAGDIADELSNTKANVTALAVEYSDKYGVITKDTFELIRALEQQGDKIGAIKVLSGAVADEMGRRNKEMVESTRGLAKAWDEVKTSVSGVYNQIKTGLSASPELFKLQHLQGQLADAQEIGDKALIKGLEEQVALAQTAVNIQSKKNEGVANEVLDRKTIISADSKWNSDGEKYLSARVKMDKEIAEAKRIGLEAGKSQLEIDKRIGEIQAEYKKKEPKEKAYTEDAGTKALDQAKQQYAVLVQQSALIEEQGAGTKVLGAAARDLVEWEQQLSDIKSKKTLTADQKSLLAHQDQITAVKMQSAEQEKLNALKKEELDTSAKLFAYQQNINAQLALSQEGYDNRLAGMGLGSEGRKRLQEDLKLQQDFQKKVNKLTDDFNNSTDKTAARQKLYDDEVAMEKDALALRLAQQEDYYTQLEKAQSNWTNGANAAWQDYVYEAGDIAGQTYDLFDNAFHGMEDSLVDFVTGGKLSFKDLADSIIADIARIIIKTQVVTPLLNALFGGGAGGGSTAGGIASLFSGSSSNGSGGGGMFSGLASLGQNLLSAWNTITGVGSSVASGYASGGISGAISGGAGYYGNMLNGIATTLSSGFTSLIGGNIAITGATAAASAATTAALTGVTAEVAAGAAASVGAEGITLAALQGAIAEGAATVGTQIGVAGATTAAASQGIAASISGALSSAAAMWPLAIVMGMYQSGKLYSAGVRPDASEMWDSAGGTALGKVSMLPQTLAAKYFEVTDGLLGKVVGGKMAAILSGSTLFQAVWSKVGSKLFGSGYQTKDTGIQLGVEDGMLDATGYIKQKKKGGLISGSSKTRYLESALDPELEASLGGAYNEKILNSLGLFSALGVQLSDAVLDGLNVAVTRISTDGRAQEDIQKDLEEWFTGLGNSAVAAISDATNSGVGNYTFDELTSFVNNLYAVNDVFALLNVNSLPVSVWGGKLTEQYIAMAGGLEALNTSTSKYYDAFFSDTEKADDTLAAVNKQFAAMNLSLPANKAGFRAMVEGIDSTTDAGRSMFLTLMSLSDSAAAAYNILETRASAAEQAVLDMANAMLETASTASGALTRAIEAERSAVTKAYNEQVTSLNDMSTIASKSVTDMSTVSNSLGAALKSLRGDSDEAVKILRAQAVATLQSALATARAGGSLSGFTGLDDALDTVSSNNTDLYSSMEDFARDQGRTAGVIAELEAINGKQLTSAEQTVKTLQDQLDQAKDAYDAQMTQYDSQLAFAQAQMDALNGVDTSVMSVTAAVNAMNAAVVAAIASISGKSNATNAGVLIDSIYKDVLGRDADAAGKQYWQDQLTGGSLNNGNIVGAITNAAAIEAAYKAAGIALNDGASYWAGQLSSGALTAAQLQEAVRNAAIANGSISGYATGGLISGPGTGTSDSIMARLSNGEYVMSADSVRMFGTGLLDQMNAGNTPAFAGGGAIRLVGAQSGGAGSSGSAIPSVGRSASAYANSNSVVVAAIVALSAQLEDIGANTQAGALNASNLLKAFNRVTDGGNAMLTKAA